MARGINIPIAADAKSVITEGKKVEGALEQVIGSLDDVGDAGKKSGDEVEKGLDGIGDEAKAQADKLERSFKDSFDAIRKDSKTVGDDVGRNSSKGFDDAGGAAGEFKDEARANFAEVTSSFSGDMDSVADLAQGTFGGLAGTLTGPLGLAFGGLAIAAGAFYNSWKENAEKTEARISDMYDDMLESGADFLSKEYIADQLKLIYDGADDAAIKVKELRDLATASNIPEPLLARALVGDKQAQAEVATAISEQRLAINETLDEATAKGSNMAPALAPAITALQDIEDKIDGTSGALTTAQTNAKAAADAIAGIRVPTDGVATSAEDAMAKFDGLGRKISSLPTPTPVVIPVTADLSGAKRQIKAFTDGTYAVTVNGRVTGVKYQ